MASSSIYERLQLSDTKAASVQSSAPLRQSVEQLLQKVPPTANVRSKANEFFCAAQLLQTRSLPANMVAELGAVIADAETSLGPENLEAAIAFLRSKTFESKEVLSAAGVGVTVTQAQIEAAVDEVMEQLQVKERQDGILLDGTVIREVRRRLPFAPRATVAETVATKMKAVSADGQLNKDEIKMLQRKMRKTANKQENAASAIKQEGAASAPETDDSASHASDEADEQEVTPYTVKGKKSGVDYELLINQFGTSRITPEQLQRFSRFTKDGRLHRFLARGIFFSHRDFDTLLDRLDGGNPVYLYTGRGPSSQAMHLGHLVPFIFTKYLQDALDVPLVVQMTDDEKYLFKPNLTLDYDKETGVRFMLRENVKDIIAVGFDPKKTLIFSDLETVGGRFYENVVKIQRHATLHTVKKLFGFDDSFSIGQVAFPAIQAAPSFPNTFPPEVVPPGSYCLIPCAIDQDPFFRMTRDVAPKLNYNKPALLHAKFFPALEGANSKMSSSVGTPTTVFLTDTADEIRSKIHKHAFSGAPATLKELEEQGVNLEVDVPFQYLSFFLDDEDELEEIRKEYGAGRMTSTQVKDRLVQVLQEVVRQHQEAREKVTEEMVDHFMSVAKFM